MPIQYMKKLLILAKPMLVASFLGSDFPTENPRTQNRTILIDKRCS
ncbi:hypothetical protein SAMN05428642_102710 [Flaviramulus basaltis]|uniref:Uncharacterized protein n=1 Tax=Flaviramulus basaltis TaxID=369401 RepID=A0A1K2IJE1_9FLAO|nr:hypothetical protein SAMN05428642_102710 [Flaviramulus basaltis]